MKLLTDGTTNNPMLGFCLGVISRYGESWPLTEEVLAGEFTNWFGSDIFLTRDALQSLCLSKGVNLSFSSLPQEIRGFNFSFGEKHEIVLPEREIAPFSDLHTIFHEFRELLEHEFTELGKATFCPEVSSLERERRAEHFAVACRMKEIEKELPALMEMAQSVEKKLARYLAYALLVVFGAAYTLHCLFFPKMEQLAVEPDAADVTYLRNVR